MDLGAARLSEPPVELNRGCHAAIVIVPRRARDRVQTWVWFGNSQRDQNDGILLTACASGGAVRGAGRPATAPGQAVPKDLPATSCWRCSPDVDAPAKACLMSGVGSRRDVNGSRRRYRRRWDAGDQDEMSGATVGTQQRVTHDKHSYVSAHEGLASRVVSGS